MKILLFIINHYKRWYIFPFWIILYLFSLIYRIIIINKRKNGYQHRIDNCFVLCVGNLTTGGTGKTEVTAYLSEVFFRKHKTAVVLRGYKRKTDYAMQVNKALSISDIGDEAKLLFQKIKSPVFIAKKRKQGVILAKKQKRDFIILDDAFQHWDLNRDFNLVLIDYTNPFGNNYLIPAGILREPVKALRDADTVLITKYCDKKTEYTFKDLLEKIRRYNRTVPIFFSSYEFDNLYLKNKKIPIRKIKRKRILIITGIGNPDYFKTLVQRYLIPEKLEIKYYDDHHEYTKEDIQYFNKQIKHDFDYIVTTLKDYVKMKQFKFEPIVFNIKLKIEKEKEFLNIIKRFKDSKI